jgi:hypothetical protein
MDANKIAERVVRSLRADSGDVPVYFNIGDFFKSDSGGKISASQGDKAEAILGKAENDVWKELEKAVKQGLKKYESELMKIGLVLK